MPVKIIPLFDDGFQEAVNDFFAEWGDQIDELTREVVIYIDDQFRASNYWRDWTIDVDKIKIQIVGHTAMNGKLPDKEHFSFERCSPVPWWATAYRKEN